jgi:CheY-like chemotaxis protein
VKRRLLLAVVLLSCALAAAVVLRHSFQGVAGGNGSPAGPLDPGSVLVGQDLEAQSRDLDRQLQNTDVQRELLTRLSADLIDDNADHVSTTAALLRLAGHEAHTALTSADALEAAGRLRPEVVLLDLGLPGMDGYELARQMKTRGEAPPPFFIAITGFGQEEDRRRCWDAGIPLHLLKPVDPDYLLNVLARFSQFIKD